MKLKTFLSGMLFLLIFVCISQAQQSEIRKGEIQEMVHELCQLMTDHYVYPDIAEEICDTLQYNLEKGEYDVTTYKALAELLSRDLKSVNQDLHLNVWSILHDQYNQDIEEVDPINRQLHIIRENAARSFSFTKVEILEGNIGYLELIKFETIPEPRLERMLEGAMDFLSNCSALILDLRRNNGGNLLMIQRFMSYFFENEVPITGQYTRESGGIREYSTLENFHHRHLVDIPLFVLVSSSTVSGPEEVAYDLQVEKRAVIIGEKTMGAANPSYFYRIKEKLLVCIPYGYYVHPKTRSSWEGPGVTPDVIVPADSALITAINLAKQAAEKVEKKEQERVDILVVKLKEHMRLIEYLLVSDIPEAERLFDKTLDEFYQIEYMNKYLLFSLFDSYEEGGNDAACEMIGKQGILRYPDEDRFYSRLGNLYFKEGDLEKALQIYSDLLELNPNNVSVAKKIQEIRNDIHKSNYPFLTGPYLGQKPPEMTPELFAPVVIAGIGEHQNCLTFTPDVKYLF